MEFRLPELGEGVYEAEMTRWLTAAGQAVAPGQPLLEVLTDKATMEVPSPFAGIVTALLVEPGRKLKIGESVLQYETQESVAAPPTPIAPPRNDPPPEPAEATVKAAPAVRRMAKNLGVDLAAIRGTGPEGRVLLADLQAHSAPKIEAGKRIKLHGIRRKIAEQMTLSKQTIPHYTYVDECDVSDLVRVRTGLRERFAKQNVKLTYLAFFVKALGFALKETPTVNASLDEAAGEIVLRDGCHVGIAVDTPAGLMVPVVRDVDRLGLFDIAGEIQRLSAEARAGKSKLDDLRGATFTLTSIGNIGGLFATPIIPPGQVGILGIGKITQRPVFDSKGRVVPADMIYLSFSFDHRVVDGAVGAAFGNALIARIKNPVDLAADV